MKVKTRSLLWVCLLVSIVLILPAVKSRIKTESKNKSVILTADFYEFYNAINQSDVNKAGIQAPFHSIEDLLAEFKKANVFALTLEETQQAGNGIPGFDIQLMEELAGRGFELILKPSGISHTPQYYQMLGSVISRFSVRYIIFDDKSSGLNSFDISSFSNILKNNNVFLILSENQKQDGYVSFKGLTELIDRLEYRLNRTYILTDNDLNHLKGQDILYRWLRAVVDRNIRVVYLRPLNSSGLNADNNIQAPLDAVAELATLLIKKGYSVNQPLNYLLSKPLSPFMLILIILSLVLAVMLYLEYLPDRSLKVMGKVFVVSFILCVIFNIMDGMNLPLFLSVLASVLYPSLTVLLLTNYWTYSKGHSLLFRLVCSLTIMFCVLSFGALTITAAMSGSEFILHLKNFSGALLTYTIPLITFTINFISITDNIQIKKQASDIFKYIKWPIILLTLFILYIYLSRSGNSSLIPATKAELILRNWFERFLPVRPRFKEIAIGYPSLITLLYLKIRKPNPYILYYLGCGVTIGLISITNSFCHGFTPIVTSVLRTLEGFIIGTLTACVFILFFSLQDLIRQKFLKGINT